jgi:hypothetical protein
MAGFCEQTPMKFGEFGKKSANFGGISARNVVKFKLCIFEQSFAILTEHKITV